MSATVSPGSTLAGYRIEELVGRGGMGVVYRATDLRLDRSVALKLVAPELAQDDRFRERFLKESRMAAALDHPNVLPIHEAGESDGQLYLVMRYVEGQDLKSLLERDLTLAAERTVAILGQVADALDAAHRRGLVHRDVKPANILVDEDGHAYLADFGITKQAGAASTQTGEMVGTLDYLAPEQIRGEPVDGRTDSYALGCVLFECLAGAPPFRRETHAETLWAHLHDEPPALGGHRAFDPVLAKALAKETDERFASCRDLVDAASEALGLAAPARAKPVGRRLMHRRRAILYAGLVLLAATVAAAIVVVTGGGESAAAAPAGNGVAAIDPRGDSVASFIESGHAPSNIAVGEGAVWVMSANDKTISRIDPKTLAVTGRITAPGQPTDIAAGLGALWIGKGGGPIVGSITVGVARVDPRTGAVTHSARLPDRKQGVDGAGFNWGFANIAVGDGAVWALDPDQTIARIDPKTGRVVATVDVEAGGVAAGDGGVWALVSNSVVRINPRTNRPGQTIPLTTAAPTAIAVGAGKVWVTAEQEGVVWRIDPGPSPVARTIPVGVGVTYIAYGAGALWTANYLDGTVSRIDPVTNEVTHIPVNATQALAAGEGSAWASSAGGAEPGTLPASTCDDVVSGGGTPDVLIASDLPLQGGGGVPPRAMVDAIRLVLRKHSFRAGRFRVGYRSCDDSTAQTGNFENRRCAANANAYARADKLVAVIGPYNSYCAQVEIPILNRAPGGPLAMIGATTTYTGLTRRGGSPPPDGYRNEPQVYYPTGVRNFVRLMPGDDELASAQAVLAKQLGLDSVYVLDDGSGVWKAVAAEHFRRAARELGLRIAGSETIDPHKRNQGALAEAVARSGAQGVMIAAWPNVGGAAVVQALRKRLGQRVTLLGSFGFGPISSVLELAGPAARGMYIATNDLPRANEPLGDAGRQFAADMGESAKQYLGVLEAGQATELLLQAIARSDGSRASVLRELKASKVRNGILGSFGFDANGDITTAPVPIVRVTGNTRPGAGLPGNFQGSVLDRMVRVPAALGQ
jgi:ABC-type branched-subunit amino acid transport system substrate-binding protein/DNA-binding beta-propeller fold protein YncE